MDIKRARVSKSLRASRVISRRRFLKASASAMLLSVIGLPTLSVSAVSTAAIAKKKIKPADRKAAAKRLRKAQKAANYVVAARHWPLAPCRTTSAASRTSPTAHCH